MRRRLLWAGAAALVLLPLFGRAALAADLAAIKQRGYLVVATEDDFRPFEYVKDGVPTGYDNELLKRLRKFAPFEIRQNILPWTGLLAGVSTGKYDVAVTGALITRERQESLDFTMPIAEATVYYLKRKDDSSINSVQDLSGRTLGVQAGSAMLQKLPELEAMLKAHGGKLGKVVQYTSYPEAYQDLAIGRVDYVTNAIVNLQTVIREKPDIFALGQPVASKTYVGWAVAKGNAELLAFLNTFLAQEKKSGELYALQKTFLGQTFEDMPLTWIAKN